MSILVKKTTIVLLLIVLIIPLKGQTSAGINALEMLESDTLTFDSFSSEESDARPYVQVADDPTEKSSSFSEDDDDSDRYKDNKRPNSWRRKSFKGHWAGVGMGFNNYVTEDIISSIPQNINYMSLHSSKSLHYQLNFSQYSLGFTRHIGIVTGLGVTWNNFVFDGNNNIQKGDDGVIEIRQFEPDDLVKRSKFAAVYLTIPALFEIQTTDGRFYASFGPVGAIKLCSYSKMVFENKDAIKSDSDFSLNMFKVGATARIGFNHCFQLYANAYSPLFKFDKTPGDVDLFPFEVGLAITF